MTIEHFLVFQPFSFFKMTVTSFYSLARDLKSNQAERKKKLRSSGTGQGEGLGSLCCPDLCLTVWFSRLECLGFISLLRTPLRVLKYTNLHYTRYFPDNFDLCSQYDMGCVPTTSPPGWTPPGLIALGREPYWDHDQWGTHLFMLYALYTLFLWWSKLEKRKC